jgi:hypothetical protein
MGSGIILIILNGSGNRKRMIIKWNAEWSNGSDRKGSS